MKMPLQTEQGLTPDDVAEFLKPLIDISTCDETSLTNLRQNYKEIILKHNETGRPILLRVSGQHLLLINAKTYFDLETQRRCVISRFRGIEDAIQVGKVDVADRRFVELEMIQREISRLEDVVKNSSWNVKQAEKELSNARIQAVRLKSALSNGQLTG